MKALKLKRFGSINNLSFQEMDIPSPGDDEVLVKIKAASVNSSDVEYIKGTFLMRMMGSPRGKILGFDMSGVVEAVGKNVGDFKAGDEVLADLYSLGFGAYAQYVCVAASELSRKPKSVSFEEAACVPQAAVCAIQSLQKHELSKGDKVLINGAGGGMGSFALQMAKNKGAVITAVDRADKAKLMKSLGAETSLDYKQVDYTKSSEAYDLIIDMHADKKTASYKGVLKPGGTFVMVGGKLSTIFAVFITGGRTKKTEGKDIGLLMWRPNDKDDIAEVLDMMKDGDVKPAIDKVFSFDDAIEAIEYCLEGNAMGKVVISME